MAGATIVPAANRAAPFPARRRLARPTHMAAWSMSDWVRAQVSPRLTLDHHLTALSATAHLFRVLRLEKKSTCVSSLPAPRPWPVRFMGPHSVY
jgi:hypothetical protein